MTEADTCRRFVVPRLVAAGWDHEPHAIQEQRSITDGRIIPAGKGFVRKAPKRVDYLLRYETNFPIAVVEAKAYHKSAVDGLQQAMEYAQMLGLSFAYATNGKEILEFDYLRGTQRTVQDFPSPETLWERYCAAKGMKGSQSSDRLATPMNLTAGKTPRYYQEIAINRAMEGILVGRRRQLLVLATGTGKTTVAFQLCWKLWNSRWNRIGEFRKPKILFLADRNILVDDPKDKDFSPFGDARFKLEGGVANFGREIFFAIYQALSEDERRDGLFRQFKPDFFDLIIVDECHRGSSRDDSSWRAILEYFEPAYQIGLTATPVRDEARDSFSYFGDPIYQYSLRQGIEDGFLAPYRVHRIVTDWDAAGWRPSQGDLDRYGRPIPDDEYQTKDFERTVALRARTVAIAKHLTQFLKGTSRFDKTIVFCVDQEHAGEMLLALREANADLLIDYPDYVCRVTSDEKEIGRGHLSRFQDVDTKTPTILTTSQMLTTGVDAPTVKNVVLARVVGSMSEFKQIIGRGTRVRGDYGKFWFNILDYTGTATRNFLDAQFDGDPVAEIESGMNEPVPDTSDKPNEQEVHDERRDFAAEAEANNRQKLYFDGGRVEIGTHLVYELDPDGNQLKVSQYSDYASTVVRGLTVDAATLGTQWATSDGRLAMVAKLGERGVSFDKLAELADMPEADPLDLLCHLAFNAPLRTRRERAQRLKREHKDFFEQFSPVAREILDELLEKYSEHGSTQFVLPDILQVPPLNQHGTVQDILHAFGDDASKLRQAVADLHDLLYAA